MSIFRRPPTDSAQRTAEQRERDRVQREQRRERTDEFETVEPDAPMSADDGLGAEPPTPVADEDQATAVHATLGADVADTGLHDPQAIEDAPLYEQLDAFGRPLQQPPAEDPLPGEQSDDAWDWPEPAAGLAALGAASTRPASARRPPPDRRRGGRRAGGPRREPLVARNSGGPITSGRVGVFLVVVLVVVVGWFAISLFQPFHGSPSGHVVVTVPHGDSAKQIGDLLASKDVVSSGFFFSLRALISGKRDDLRPGTYTMQHDMTYKAAIDQLSTPPPPAPVVPVIHVVIPEGDARVEIAAIARANHLRGSYLRASKKSSLLSPRSYGAPAHTRSLEGFLFPATYDLDKGARASVLVGDQLEAFKHNFGPVEVRAARRHHVTPYGLLTVASMVEREAQLPADRPRVAGVIYRRLKLGMPLGIDATIRYALNDWDKPLTESQLQIHSRYNTRIHTGLPPTPIGNPGLASIKAAAHPSKVPYLYYVAGADGCGDLVFSRTYAKFQSDVSAYRDAVAANGGNVPTCKKR